MVLILKRLVVFLGAACALSFQSVVSLAHSYNIIYNFAYGSGGSNPQSDVTLDGAGNIFGTTSEGGSAGYGTLYKIAQDGTETVLHAFDGGNGGRSPIDGVIVRKDGAIYGTTFYGGSSNVGTVWQLSPDGAFSILHSFTQTDGNQYPDSRLIADKNGNLYGTTLGDPGGCTTYCGTIFEVTSKGKFHTIHRFKPPANAYPQGTLLRDESGNFYGVTENGGVPCECGTVYKLAPGRPLTTLYKFNYGKDGGFPIAGLARDDTGNILGSTSGAGKNHSGTVFKLTPAGKLEVLYNLKNGNRASDLLLVGNDIYGTMSGMGADAGSVFRIGVNSKKEKTLHHFANNQTDGGYPQAGLAISREGTLYGTTAGGGTHGLGTVFSFKTN